MSFTEAVSKAFDAVRERVTGAKHRYLLEKKRRERAEQRPVPLEARRRARAANVGRRGVKQAVNRRRARQERAREYADIVSKAQHDVLWGEVPATIDLRRNVRAAIVNAIMSDDSLTEEQKTQMLSELPQPVG